MVEKIEKTETQWRELLTPEEFRVCRGKGTEPPLSGIYCDEKRPGQYNCKCCGQALFRSETKYDSGTGWPSFWAPIQDDAIACHRDTNHGMVRVEAVCGRCGAHLGHVFEDGPAPTGQRYCMNSLSLDLVPDAD